MRKGYTSNVLNDSSLLFRKGNSLNWEHLLKCCGTPSQVLQYSVFRRGKSHRVGFFFRPFVEILTCLLFRSKEIVKCQLFSQKQHLMRQLLSEVDGYRVDLS